MLYPQNDGRIVAIDSVTSLHFALCITNGPITVAIRARFEYDSSTIRAREALLPQTDRATRYVAKLAWSTGAWSVITVLPSRVVYGSILCDPIQHNPLAY